MFCFRSLAFVCRRSLLLKKPRSYHSVWRMSHVDCFGSLPAADASVLDRPLLHIGPPAVRGRPWAGASRSHRLCANEFRDSPDAAGDRDSNLQCGVATQAIYYAKNIASAAAGANTVTVTFNVAARFPDIRIAEYSGIDTVNPLDVSVGAQGSTTTSSSGSVATTNPNDLLIGANLVQSTSTAAGAGYTNRGITPDGDILEDRVVTATGSYSATAALDTVQQWIMQMVAF